MSWDNITDKFSSVGEGVGRFAKRLFGSENEREIKRLTPVIAEINELESWATGLDREQVRAEVEVMRQSVRDGKATLDDVLTKMFALTREASQRTLGMRHYDVQLVGGFVLHQGKIAEMMTGEGKTLMATLALALNALSDRPCYLVTVNDYLARRDAEWMKPIYEYLGLTVGSIQSDLDPSSRKPVYACDIVYATNNELGFDYLRDNMKTSLGGQVQKDLYFAIVDEVDSILIDEARTPLIISGPAEDHVGRYKEADTVARALVAEEHYEVKEKERMASLTEEGIVKAQELLGVESFYVPGFEDWPHYIENALRAHSLYELDKEYVVEESEDPHTGMMRPEVVIVDEFTGRKMAGRRWSDGLHQAVEVKEGLEPKQETQTLATITFQNYFRMFDKLAGMTGTALTEAGEFHKIYELDVVSVPTNRPIARDDKIDTVYRTLPEKWNAICDEIERVHGTGQPVLVGTASVDNSEHLSKLLKDRGVPHEVLNAKNHEREAHIVAMAGTKGAITVSTNMAGRGTDIKLGGNFEYMLSNALEEAGLVEGDLEKLDEIAAVRERVEKESEAAEAEVLALGGLYVLGTERHEARRIDNQLRGRTGRQGNVGETRFFLSLQDPLMRIFYRDWVVNAMERLGMSEGQPIESGMVTRQVARAQKKVEDRNFEIRKNLLEYDEVMDHQRTEIYAARQAVLEGENLRDRILIMMTNLVDRTAGIFEGDAEGFIDWCQKTFDVEISPAAAATAVSPDRPSVDSVMETITARYDERREEWGEKLTERIESYLVLTAIDQKWKDHLHAMDALKAGIGLRGYAQEDPKIAYKKEATELFAANLLPAIESDVSSKILRIEVGQPEGERPADRSGEAAPGGDQLAPRGIGQGAGRPPQGGQPGADGQPEPKKIRFDELTFDQQKQFIHQLDANQRLTLMAQMPKELRDPLIEAFEPAAVEQHREFASGLDGNQQLSLLAQMPPAIRGDLMEHLGSEGAVKRQDFVKTLEVEQQLNVLAQVPEELRASLLPGVEIEKLQAFLKGLDLDKQLTILVQIPADLREAMTPGLDEEIVAKIPEAIQQFEAYKVQMAQQQEAQKQQQQQQMRGPAASSAFDVMKRQKMIEEQRRRAEEAARQQAAGESSTVEANEAQASGTQASGTQASETQASGTQASGTQASGTQASGTRTPGSGPAPESRPSSPRPAATARRPAAATNAVGELGPEFKNAARNEPCPCGSGKKFKKCHGR
ncbi:preprotein translocase subunit SecA [Planctomycetes bacterium Poly30]|uniref:Protein translocase subunit SecA n=1 Tax=Saltatorellus ferox TaxID=2528018 RepID=A0A518ESK9_9BACT|nr:preprotein translocase subunit SecA [Planctomycetes bacterium Poly30]